MKFHNKMALSDSLCRRCWIFENILILILGCFGLFGFSCAFLDMPGHGEREYPGSLDNKVIIIIVLYCLQMCFKWHIPNNRYCNYISLQLHGWVIEL